MYIFFATFITENKECAEYCLLYLTGRKNKGEKSNK